eukprot:CAMPEP_0168338888 /NCGR_PEP_ID=MMETSP0213-20121227/13129_1 /TAXON_ID=151035 /ORGANISM="Euplotes harpa, Strain FSP1.4" /LENGTH=74 /DNA_ID=CAMNT_0008344805 /DNA_START=42 /DNA_END=266 /DNA_ORIENTATION=+
MNLDGSVRDSELELTSDKLAKLAKLVIYMLSDINYLTRISKDKLSDMTTASVTLEDNTQLSVAVASDHIKVIIS